MSLCLASVLLHVAGDTWPRVKLRAGRQHSGLKCCPGGNICYNNRSQTLYIGVGDAFGAGNGGVEVLGAATGNQLQYADLHSAATSSPAVIMSWLYVGHTTGICMHS
jgi:hypothetical protein